MQVNDILNKAVALLGINDLVIAPSSTDERVARLVNALGVSYMQLITEYAPLEDEASITVTGGAFDLLTLPKKFFDAVKLVGADGCAERFRIRGSLLAAEDGTYLLRYYYTPSSYPSIGGALEISPRIPLDLFARGVAAEYALESMMFEEAALFERRYKEGLSNVLSVHADRRMPFGRWI